MKCKEIKYYLNDYLDGLLPNEMRFEIETHLKICKVCNAEYEELKSIIEEADSVPDEIEPSRDLWKEINNRISGGIRTKHKARIFSIKDRLYVGPANYKLKFKPPEKYPGKKLVVSLAVSIVILISFIAFFYINQSSTAFWAVEKLSGSPYAGTEKVDDFGILKVGDWLETDNNSRARLKVGDIGELDVDPESRLQLIETKPDEYRINLERGRIHAAIWAPPKLFFVETPSATAVDLGCMYTLQVDKYGSSFLRVTSGWVALEFKDREAFIPQGAMCETILYKGPGTPYYEDASQKFIAALEKIDFTNYSKKELHSLLNESRKKDVLSLWHLLQTTPKEDRKLIYNKIASFINIPQNINRDAVINGDKKDLKLLWEKLGFGSQELFQKL